MAHRIPSSFMPRILNRGSASSSSAEDHAHKYAGATEQTQTMARMRLRTVTGWLRGRPALTA